MHFQRNYIVNLHIFGKPCIFRHKIKPLFQREGDEESSLSNLNFFMQAQEKLKSDFLQILCLSLVQHLKHYKVPLRSFPNSQRVVPSLWNFSPPFCQGIYLRYPPAWPVMWNLEKFNGLYRSQSNYSRVIRHEKSQPQTHPYTNCFFKETKI